MIVAIWLATAIAQTCPTAPSPTSLDQAMGRTLTIVRSGNPHALLAQMSPDGVAFGAQGKVAYAALSDQFARRTGRYCDLFICNGAVGRLNALFTGGKTVRTFDAANRRATVVLNGRSPRELDLSYAYSARCQWELTAIGPG